MRDPEQQYLEQRAGVNEPRDTDEPETRDSLQLALEAHAASIARVNERARRTRESVQRSTGMFLAALVRNGDL